LTDTDLAIATQAEFEGFLKYTLDASGSSFAELITSIRERLPRNLVDDLHYVRKERNNLAHSRKLELDSRQIFEEVSARTRESLLRVAIPSGYDIGYSIVNKKSGSVLMSLGKRQLYRPSMGLSRECESRMDLA
jgi:hypothetical protein